jgi:hypothetical protein
VTKACLADQAYLATTAMLASMEHLAQRAFEAMTAFPDVLEKQEQAFLAHQAKRGNLAHLDLMDVMAHLENRVYLDLLEDLALKENLAMLVFTVGKESTVYQDCLESKANLAWLECLEHQECLEVMANQAILARKEP